MCVCVRMKNFEAHLMVSAREVNSKVLRMAIKFCIFMRKGKVANILLEMLDRFSSV